MSNAQRQYKITWVYVLVCCIVVFLSFFFHELAHWLAGTILGNKMGMSLNSTYPVSGTYSGPHDDMIVSAAGPLFTIIQAIVCYVLMLRKDPLLFPALFTPLYMRALAAGMTFINPNDEARISRDLGIGIYTLPVIVCIFLFYLVWAISRKRGISLKFILQTLGFVMLFSPILILADQFLKIHII